jgi:hypothetical protein
MQTLPPLDGGNQFAPIVANTRARHMVPREIVEKQIERFFPRRTTKRLRHRSKRRNPDT